MNIPSNLKLTTHEQNMLEVGLLPTHEKAFEFITPIQKELVLLIVSNFSSFTKSKKISLSFKNYHEHKRFSVVASSLMREKIETQTHTGLCGEFSWFDKVMHDEQKNTLVIWVNNKIYLMLYRADLALNSIESKC